ncbi:hypothetical protein [Streptomyces lutosisoli]|uniref:Uncharacterized protein n=1 Tax=Streptomyces lutosisoli TaxID=2665721 RepID=A0ABW2VTL9_9ACTN
MYLVVTDAALGAVVVAPDCAEALDAVAQDVIERAAFVWRPGLEAYVKPGQDRAEAASIAMRLAALGHTVEAH